MQIASLATAIAVGLLAAAVPARAQTMAARFATPAPTDDIDYAILLAVSEPVAFDGETYAPQPHEAITEVRRREQAQSAADRPAVPDFTAETETPELSRAVQLATSYRLRGETVAAAEAYATVMALSRKPIHAFFYAEVARANGDELLANHLSELYREAKNSGGELPAASRSDARDIRIAGVVTDAATGTMLSGVEVRVLDPLAHRTATTATDANGLFVIDGVSRGAHVDIVAARRGFAVGTETLHIDPAHTQHAPVVGVRVYLQPVHAGAALNQ